VIELFAEEGCHQIKVAIGSNQYVNQRFCVTEDEFCKSYNNYYSELLCIFHWHFKTLAFAILLLAFSFTVHVQILIGILRLLIFPVSFVLYLIGSFLSPEFISKKLVITLCKMNRKCLICDNEHLGNVEFHLNSTHGTNQNFSGKELIGLIWQKSFMKIAVLLIRVMVKLIPYILTLWVIADLALVRACTPEYNLPTSAVNTTVYGTEIWQGIRKDVYVTLLDLELIDNNSFRMENET